MDTPDPTIEPQADLDPELDAEEDDQGEDEGEVANLLALSEILPLSQYRLTLSEFDRQPSDRVQFALDCALIAACERVARILRGDLS